MKTFLLISLLAVGQGLFSCKKCTNCDLGSAGPMASVIGITSLKWVKTETPSGVLTPAQAGYSEQIMNLRRHVYVVRDDSLISVRRKIQSTDNWGAHQYTNLYDDGYRQTFQLIYQGNNNTRDLKSVIVHAAYKGDYDSKADTVLMHCENAGPVPGKYREIEDKSGY